MRKGEKIKNALAEEKEDIKHEKEIVKCFT